jgi:hypothetical protein
MTALFGTLGMARGTLVVDENVAGGLSEALRDANFHVVVPEAGDSDEYISTTLRVVIRSGGFTERVK